jgi:hypothetical protein
VEAARSFDRLEDTIDADTVRALQQVRAGSDGIGAGDDLEGPASTWTYAVSDDPFRNQIGQMLTGPGRATIAIAAATLTMPLLILWGLVERWLRRRQGRRV